MTSTSKAKDWQLNSLFARLLKVKYFESATSHTLFPSVWTYLGRPLNRLPQRLGEIQRNSFSTMPEMIDKKVDLDLNLPHPRVRGMTTLDRAAFTRVVVIPALKVKKDIINKLAKALKGLLIKRPGLKRVVEDPEDESQRLILLDPQQIPADCSLGKSEQEILKSFNVNPEIVKCNVELTYAHFKADEILQAVLPEGQEVTTAFSRVGHIAHLNLRDHQLPYKHLIGQVIIDKNQGITCAVNKINNIENAYRNFQMEVLAGDETNMITKVKEHYCSYEFDFSKVYWNPRLSTEHTRIVDFLKPGDLLFDVFAGVGPFAIPAAKKNCVVFANDLNPESYKWLQHNCKLNKVDKKVKVFNMDGRDFLRGPVKEELAKQLPLKERESSLHIVMNLPAMAIEFLDVFRHLLEGAPVSNALPTVHCYCFSKDGSPAQAVQERVEACLETSLEGLCSIELVRRVAPNKDMFCISFRLPAEVLFRPPSSLAGTDNLQEPASKRLRPNEDSPEESLNRV
ncbi:tRNA (guanine(37)-N1)-methyltransferase isoform X2 [Varanus komodoensis]|uniref:tRNA (guanine(37)-N1)-methyltransferase n=1 Tax=Varanus komodoensis TaxID=61221 RepID=A0A8D2KR28_VARKO|nr:tRNA (guanine(37)-N1)-methyltransferase isoform X2 [Varanus komodoensis]